MRKKGLVLNLLIIVLIVAAVYFYQLVFVHTSKKKCMEFNLDFAATENARLAVAFACDALAAKTPDLTARQAAICILRDRTRLTTLNKQTLADYLSPCYAGLIPKK